MEQGNSSGVTGVGGGVLECRIHFGPGNRVCLGKDGDALIILLGGGTKKRQQTGYRDRQRPLAGVQATQATGDSRIMALTRNFRETIQARIRRDPAFREELFKEGIECLLAGDVDTGKAVLRDFINATVGFQELGRLTAKSPKSLMRMFGPNGNPQARNLFEVVGCLQAREGFHLKVQSVR